MTSAIPEGFVPLDYLMDPATEDVIPGSKLRDGMVVLLDDTLLRFDPDSLEKSQSKRDLVSAYKTARWCRVTNLNTTPNNYTGTIRHFIGVYADGSKFSRQYNAHYNWFVKLDSIS